MKAIIHYGLLSITLITMSTLHAIKYDPAILAKLSLVDLRVMLDKAQKIHDAQLMGQITTEIKRLEAEEGIVVKGAKKEDIFIRNSQTGKLTALTGEELTVAQESVTPDFPAGVSKPTAPPAGFKIGEGEWVWIKAGDHSGPAWHPTASGTVPIDAATNAVVGSFTPASAAEVAALPPVSLPTPPGEIPAAPPIPGGEVPPAPPLGGEGVPVAPPLGGPEAPPLPPEFGRPEAPGPVTKKPPAVAPRLELLTQDQIAALTPEQQKVSDMTVSKQLAMLAERYPKNLSAANYVNDLRGGKIDEGLEVLLRDKDRYPFYKQAELQELVGSFNKSGEGLISAYAGLGKGPLDRLKKMGLEWDKLPQLDAVDTLKNDDKGLRELAIARNIAEAHELFNRLLFGSPSQQFNDAVELIVWSLMALNRKAPELSDTITLANITSDHHILAIVAPDPEPSPIPMPKIVVRELRALLIDPAFQLYQKLMVSPARVADIDRSNPIKAMSQAPAMQMLTDSDILDKGRNEKFIALDIKRDFLFQKESDDAARIEPFIAKVLEAGRGAQALEKKEVPIVAFAINEFIQNQLPNIKSFVDMRKAVETVASKAGDKDVKDMLNALATVLKETPEVILYLGIEDMLAQATSKKEIDNAAAANLQYIKENIPAAQQAMYNQVKTWLTLLQKVMKKPDGQLDILNDLTRESGLAVINKVRSLQKDMGLYLEVLADFRKLVLQSRKAALSGKGERTYRGIEFINAVKALQQGAQPKDTYILSNLLKALTSITRTPDSLYTYMNQFFGPMVGSLEDLKIKKDDFILMFEEYGTLLDALKQIAVLDKDKQYEALYNSLRALNTARLEPGVEYVSAVSIGAPSGRYSNKLNDLFNALPTKNQLATTDLMKLGMRFGDFRKALGAFVTQTGIGIEKTKEFTNILYSTLVIIQDAFIQAIREKLEAINKGTALTVPGLEASGKQGARNIAFLSKLQAAKICTALLKMVPDTIGEFDQDAFVAALHTLFAQDGPVMRAGSDMSSKYFAPDMREKELSAMRSSLRRYLLSIENALELFKQVGAEEPLSNLTDKQVIDMVSAASPMSPTELDAISMVVGILIVADAAQDVIIKDCIARIAVMRSIDEAVKKTSLESAKQALLMLKEEAGDPFITVEDIQAKLGAVGAPKASPSLPGSRQQQITAIRAIINDIYWYTKQNGTKGNVGYLVQSVKDANAGKDTDKLGQLISHYLAMYPAIDMTRILTLIKQATSSIPTIFEPDWLKDGILNEDAALNLISLLNPYPRFMADFIATNPQLSLVMRRNLQIALWREIMLKHLQEPMLKDAKYWTDLADQLKDLKNVKSLDELNQVAKDIKADFKPGASGSSSSGGFISELPAM